ncbi:hemolysin family protein [Desertibaculum subflavum]|uniref:hemolysin family protein n=1 Tax=Desertibaculum subflavum TaxID=2268458 RepID=UPI000E666CF4
MLLESLAILLLILLNGFFAMAELAVVSAKRARLEVMEDAGNAGAGLARTLAEEPERFLPTVQIGITLIGVLAGALSGATIADKLAAWLAGIPALAPAANGLSIAIVVVIVTYLSLVLGELVPKRLALRRPEPIAAFVARPLDLLSRIGAPIVFLLRVSTEAVLRLVGAHREADPGVTEAEIRTIIEEGAEHGVIEEEEREMISGVMRLADRPARALMTHRTDIVWLNIDDDPKVNLRKIVESGRSRFPVCRGSIDDVMGIVQAKDLLDWALADKAFDLRAVVKEASVIPEGADAFQVLDLLKRSPIHMALVVDEYGSLLGVVTATDVLETIVGELAGPEGPAVPEVVTREDGTWLIDGALNVDRLTELLDLATPPEAGEFHTVAGFVLWRLGHIPQTGESFEWNGFRFEVVDMDGRRIDKVLVSPIGGDGGG